MFISLSASLFTSLSSCFLMLGYVPSLSFTCLQPSLVFLLSYRHVLNFPFSSSVPCPLRTFLSLTPLSRLSTLPLSFLCQSFRPFHRLPPPPSVNSITVFHPPLQSPLWIILCCILPSPPLPDLSHPCRLPFHACLASPSLLNLSRSIYTRLISSRPNSPGFRHF